MSGASDQIFLFKALTSSIGLLASDLLVQGFELCDRVIRVRPYSARLSLPRVEAFWGLSSHSRLLAHRLASSLKTFSCKDFTSESGSLFGIIFSFKALSSTLGFFA